MAPLKPILEDVLRHIKPGRKEELEEFRFALSVIRKISKACPKGREVVLAGSVAKGTFLRNSKDLDVFILVGRHFQKSRMESMLKSVMEKAFPGLGYQLSYAEHPYVRFHLERRKIDLVPAYKISDPSQRLSAVDRSVLHTKFVRNSLRKKRTGDVLLLKQLLKANTLYGAEIKTEGFSGYLCELLIINYGGFQKLLKAAARWKSPTFIDIKKYYKGKTKISEAVSRFGDFTVIDPTDMDRNVAAAVSCENYTRFIKLCKRFLAKPSRSLFFRKAETFEKKIHKAAKRHKVITVSMPRPSVVDDVLWGQLRKMLKQLKKHLSDYEPKNIFADDSKHVVRIAAVLKKDRLPSTMILEGPPLSMKKHVQQFRKTHPKAKFIKKKKKIFAIKKRPVVKAESAVAGFFRSFSSTKSHLAHPEEVLVIEKVE